jgi:hypothetical protein
VTLNDLELDLKLFWGENIFWLKNKFWDFENFLGVDLE